MKFHERLCLYDLDRRAGALAPGESVLDYYTNQLQVTGLLQYSGAAQEAQIRTYMLRLVAASGELPWLLAGRPYYSVYPGIVPYLERLDLRKCSFRDFKFPFSSLLLRFAEGHELELPSIAKPGGKLRLQTILLSTLELNPPLAAIEEGLTAFVRASRTPPFGTSNYLSLLLCGKDDAFPYAEYGSTLQMALRPQSPEETVHETLARGAKEWSKNYVIDARESWRGELNLEGFDDLALRVTRIASSIFLLSAEESEGLFVPEVLSKDLPKYQETGDNKYVEKAVRRGKLGWTLGREIEVLPHFRQGHFMFLKSGVAGREESRFVWRKGHVVKRELAAKVPHGKLGEDGEQEQT